jgi:UDP-N-acetylmuramoyl-tripeptide--D-alanyl-D-alanine ligase
VRVTDVEDLGLDGSRATLATRQGSRPLHVPLLGRGPLANVVCASAVALEMGVELDTIVTAAARLTPSPRRGVVHKLPSGVTVIDDSYNSSPSALQQALALLGRTWATRRIAVVGEMLELGALSQSLHEECGRTVAALRLAKLVTIGGESARALGVAAVAAGFPARSVTHYSSSAEAADAMSAWVTKGDVVLVKGSRGMATDGVVDRLLAGGG